MSTMEFYILFIVICFAFVFIMDNPFREKTAKEKKEQKKYEIKQAKLESMEYDIFMSRKKYEQWCYERNIEPVPNHAIDFKKKIKKRKKRKK